MVEVEKETSIVASPCKCLNFQSLWTRVTWRVRGKGKIDASVHGEEGWLVLL